MAELQSSIDQCITITTEQQCPQTGNLAQNQLNQLNSQTSKLLCNCTNNKCTNNECANNKEKSIKCLPSYLANNNNNNGSNVVDQLNPTFTTTAAGNNNLVQFNNSNLAKNTTTTKLQLSITPSTKRHHRHHSASSASAMMNCTSSFLLGDQAFTTTATQPILCNATTAIKLGHHRSISTSTIHHHLHLHHLHNNANSQIQQQQQTQLDKQPLIVKPKEDELKLDYHKKAQENKKTNDDDSMDSCSLISSSSCASERKLKDIPSCMWSLITNPVYIITCLGSCMELCIVSGFLVFLPKYLETQFSISKSQGELCSMDVFFSSIFFWI